MMMVKGVVIVTGGDCFVKVVVKGGRSNCDDRYCGSGGGSSVVMVIVIVMVVALMAMAVVGEVVLSPLIYTVREWDGGLCYRHLQFFFPQVRASAGLYKFGHWKLFE